MPNINMQVFEDVQRNQLVTELDIQTQVALDDYQVQLSDIANPTQSQDNVVIDRFGEFLPHWNETLDFDMWIKMSMEVAGKRILMLRGNSNVSSVSNGDSTFPLFEDCDGSSLDSSKWTEYYDLTPQTPGTYTSFSSGVLTLNPGTTNAHGSCIVSVANVLPLNAIVTIRMHSADSGQYPYHAVSYGNGALNYMSFPHWGLNFYNSYSERGIDNTLIKSIADSETTIDDAANGGWGSYNIIDFKMEDSEVRILKNDAAWLIGEGSNLLSGTQQLSISAGKESNGGGNMYIDYIRVRKYVATKPTWTADGAEQNIAVALKSLGRAG